MSERKGSYDIDSPDAARRELERLERHAVHGATDFGNLGVLPHFRVLELGPGSGVHTCQLAEAAHLGSVLAVDRQPAFLRAVAERAAAKGLANVTTEAHDLGTLDLGDRQFDFIYARLVFEHVTDPLDLARRAVKHLAPGGTLRVEEWSKTAVRVYPSTPEWDWVMRRAVERQRELGGEPDIGPRLRSIFTEAGLMHVTLTGFVTLGEIEGDYEVGRVWGLRLLPEHEEARGQAAFEGLIEQSKLRPTFTEGVFYQATGTKS